MVLDLFDIEFRLSNAKVIFIGGRSIREELFVGWNVRSNELHVEVIVKSTFTKVIR